LISTPINLENVPSFLIAQFLLRREAMVYFDEKETQIVPSVTNLGSSTYGSSYGVSVNDEPEDVEEVNSKDPNQPGMNLTYVTV